MSEANLGQKVVIGSNEGPDDGLGRIKDKSKWTIKASSERLPHYPVKNAIDGDTDTYWHTNYTDDGVATILTKEENPHWIEIASGADGHFRIYLHTQKRGNRPDLGL